MRAAILLLSALLAASSAIAEGPEKPAPIVPPAAAPKPARKAPSPAPRKPKSDSPDAAELKFIRDNFPTLGPAPQAQMARVLTEIKKADSSWYEGHFRAYLSAAIAQSREEALKKFDKALGSAHFNARRAASNLVAAALAETTEDRLSTPADNPLLEGRPIARKPAADPAPQAPAPSPSAPTTGPSGAPPAPPPPAPGETRDAEQSTDGLIGDFGPRLAASPALRKMAAERITSFIWTEHEVANEAGRTETISFVARTLRADKKLDEAMRASVRAAVEQWVTAEPGNAALLVWFLGVPAEQRPAEAKDAAVAKYLAGVVRDGKAPDGRLANAMRAWAEDQDPSKLVGDNPRPPFDGSDADWPQAFLKDAIENQLQPLLRNQVDARRRTEEGDAPIAVPGGPVNGSVVRRGKIGKGFSFEELFGRQGDLGVFIVGTKEERAAGTGRMLSVRIVSERPKMGKGPLVDKIAIYDITEGVAYGRTFPLNFRSADPIMIRDGGRDYYLEVDPSRRIVLTASDGTPAESTYRAKDEPVRVDDLIRDRLRRAVDGGRVVNIGGREFYVGGQSTKAGGAAVFFPVEMKDAIDDTEHAYDWRPEIMSNALSESHEGSDGRNDQAHLWHKNGDQYYVGETTYHLEWSAKDGMFVPREGALAVENPDADKNPGASSGTATSPSTPPPSTDSASTPAPKPTADSDGWPLREPYERMPATPAFPGINVQALNGQLSEAGVDAQIYQAKPNSGAVDQTYLVIYKNGGEHLVTFADPARGRWKSPKSLRLIGSILAAENEVGTVYSDLARGSAGGTEERIGLLLKGAASELRKVEDSAHAADGYQMLADVLERAGFEDAQALATVDAVKKIHQEGLPAGSFGDGKLLSAIPPFAPYSISGKIDPNRPEEASLRMVTSGVTLRLAPTVGVISSVGKAAPADAAQAPGAPESLEAPEPAAAPTPTPIVPPPAPATPDEHQHHHDGPSQ